MAGWAAVIYLRIVPLWTYLAGQAVVESCAEEKLVWRLSCHQNMAANKTYNVQIPVENFLNSLNRSNYCMYYFIRKQNYAVFKLWF